MKWSWIKKILFLTIALFGAIALFFVVGYFVKGNIFTKFLFSDHVRTVVAGDVEFAEFIDAPGLRFLQYDNAFEIRIWYKFFDESNYRLLHDSYFDTHYIPLPNINDVSCIDAVERKGYSYMAATPMLAVVPRKNPNLPPETAVYVADSKERRFLIRIEVGYNEFGEIAKNYYGGCSLPRIDERIHSHCRLSSKFYGLPKRKKERELYEKELVAYETRMMTDSVFIKGLYESFDAFNLNKDCLDSLKEYYRNVREK